MSPIFDTTLVITLRADNESDARCVIEDASAVLTSDERTRESVVGVRWYVPRERLEDV